ncbi:shikimate dehydrogenase [Cellulomonas sp. JZ18]|uniref:shikimate dehydrogenase n=1 Tax=Cellulomonas sp. JZ18 TaxID=2654191 RepID=UPI0012D3DDC6|nr:shikimate dehydrogenase [Cellulomonas sp. JZ18]QGQ19378.1 shikimate dehydrogenase [Cellulomonas sp. JZ18]
MSRPRRCAVLGHPVAHSLSPVLHGAAYGALGLDDWRYEVHDVTEEALPGFLEALDPTWAGLSLTMPLKHAVLPLLDHVEPLAQVVGAVNTVLPQGAGARRTLTGANTDVHGIVAALGEAGVTGGVRSAAVLGAGATAASTLAALAQLGCATPSVHVRSAARAGSLLRAAHRMGVEPVLRPLDASAPELATADVVVSTLPARAPDALAPALPDAARGVLLDVVYDPRPTALAQAWEARGGRTVGGERMLLHQAVEQVRLMTGRPAPVAAMDAALQAALAPVVR